MLRYDPRHSIAVTADRRHRHDLTDRVFVDTHVNRAVLAVEIEPIEGCVLQDPLCYSQRIQSRYEEIAGEAASLADSFAAAVDFVACVLVSSWGYPRGDLDAQCIRAEPEGELWLSELVVYRKNDLLTKASNSRKSVVLLGDVAYLSSLPCLRAFEEVS